MASLSSREENVYGSVFGPTELQALFRLASDAAPHHEGGDRLACRPTQQHPSTAASAQEESVRANNTHRQPPRHRRNLSGPTTPIDSRLGTGGICQGQQHPSTAASAQEESVRGPLVHNVHEPHTCTCPAPFFLVCISFIASLFCLNGSGCSRDALLALGNIAITATNQEAIAKLGGFPAVLTALGSAFTASRYYAARVASRLSNLTDNQPRLVDAGAVPLLLALAKDDTDVNAQVSDLSTSKTEVHAVLFPFSFQNV
jgi:hypothetical protein